MKVVISLLIAGALIAGAVFYSVYLLNNKSVTLPSSGEADSSEKAQSQSSGENPVSTVMVENLDTPWAIAFLPDNNMLVTERKGSIRFINTVGKIDPNPIAVIANAKEIGEGGLLGIALHPDFYTNGYVYLYYTYSNSGDYTLNRVVRMTYRNKTLRDETTIVDNIPGGANHNGGRIKFGPDGLLYIGTGDAQNPSHAQDRDSLAGKILRVTDTGKTPPSNPFGNPVYSWGHRNVQGLAWDGEGNLWATEHGRSGLQSGFDEINFIESGKNYGWPQIEGNETQSGMETPKYHSGANTTWAPSGIAFFNSSLFFGGLRGKQLYEAVLENKEVTSLQLHFPNSFGRLRDVVLGPDDMLYVTTSNKDGRGNPTPTDDRIIRINTRTF